LKDLFFGLLLNYEDDSNVFLRNVICFSTDYEARGSNSAW
jgi:hypothetical protein